MTSISDDAHEDEIVWGERKSVGSIFSSLQCKKERVRERDSFGNRENRFGGVGFGFLEPDG